MRRPALALLLGCLLLVAGASALDGYDYYQVIEYAGCDQDVYQQDIVIHRSTGTAYNETSGGLEIWHIFVGEHCLEDYGDVRFVNSTGGLAYYLWPDHDSSSARFAVRLEGATSAGTLVIWYGNPTATTTSDEGETFARVITGLVCALPLDEGTGNIVYDRSGKGNNGTLINGPSWVDGRANKKAISLDGINDYISVGSPTNLGLVGDHAYTLAIWVNPSACRDDGTYISYGPAAASKVIAITALNTNKTRSVHYSNDRTFSTPYEMNVWQHVVITYDPATSTESLFVNGEYKENWSPANLNLVAGSKLEVGRSTWNGIVADESIISDAQIYDRVLSSDEIGDLYTHANIAHKSSPGNTYIRTYSATPPSVSTFSGEQSPAALQPFPGITAHPRDLAGTGLYTDINGNNRLDYNDLIIFFQHLTWAKTAQPTSCFDFNGNGWLDYNDVITLFSIITEEHP